MLIVLALHVVLAFQESPAIAPAVVRAAVAEAADIWAPYGLTIDALTPCHRAHDDTLVVAVDISAAGMAGRGRILLGSVVFALDGTPEPRITIYLDAVLRFVASARVLGIAEWHWPRQLRQRVVERVLGRVLAHEIGHYVLHDPRHAAAGLMRPRQQSDELAAPSRKGFTLSAAEAERLASR